MVLFSYTLIIIRNFDLFLPYIHHELFLFPVQMGRVMNKPMSFLRQQCLYKLLLGLIFVVLVVTISLWSSSVDNAKKCFALSEHRLPPDFGTITLLEDISHSVKKPKPGKSIFFHETSCARNGLVHLNARYVNLLFYMIHRFQCLKWEAGLKAICFYDNNVIIYST